MNTAYLGDGVYIKQDEKDQLSFVLYTNDGIRDTNTIYLDPDVQSRLLQYIEEAKVKL